MDGLRIDGLRMKRIYEPWSETDGYRILVDRIWPRGVPKEKAQVDEWITVITPSTALRKAFNHDPEKMAWFRSAYLAELSANEHADAFLSGIHQRLSAGPVTLLTAARDSVYNHVVILIDWIKQHDPSNN